jgi:hypothetical protein
MEGVGPFIGLFIFCLAVLLYWNRNVIVNIYYSIKNWFSGGINTGLGNLFLPYDS